MPCHVHTHPINKQLDIDIGRWRERERDWEAGWFLAPWLTPGKGEGAQVVEKTHLTTQIGGCLGAGVVS